ncbi:hydroxyneurosporene dehydrogenase [Streptomyces sp. GESEQ-35]|uniref:hydroxyneurosporene dehydrogenase n=1 Tax=Streptomyces sp. GESEQ-35 TaxID=2812657 RepID=UPI001B3353FA|nr:hydroxyneurosporene dehydrogenase [Streptomyces sp. GESEQ-35]
MPRTEPCRMADRTADYQRLGLAKGEIAEWEDGFRSAPGEPGTFEWWYSDFVLDDGSTLVINFMAKDFRSPKGVNQPAAPLVTFELDRSDGTHIERTSKPHPDDFDFATDRCDLRIATNTFAGDLHTYRIHVDLDGVTADVTLTGQVPAWRPETGHILFGDGDAQKYFAWLPSVPSGAAEATLTVDGVTETRTGTGYHDHNWGDAEMARLMHHWYWMRAEVGAYTVIASYITAEKKFGFAEVPIFVLAKDGKILADEGSLLHFTKSDEQIDPVTGKPVANTVVYDYDATATGGDRYRVTFRRQSTIVQDPMIEALKGPKRLLATVAGFDGAYLRFTGQVSVEHLTPGADPERLDAPALWELMYFGKNPS